MTYLKVDNKENVIPVPFNDHWEFGTSTKVTVSPNLSDQIVGKWLASLGDVTGTLEFTRRWHGG